jgi:hypothetical protein
MFVSDLAVLRKKCSGASQEGGTRTILVKRASEEQILRECMNQYRSQYPEEFRAFLMDVQETKEGLRNRIGMSRQKTMALTALIPNRVASWLCHLISDYWDDKGRRRISSLWNTTFPNLDIHGPK